MKHNYIAGIIGLLLIVGGFFSCTDFEEGAGSSQLQESEHFDGTVYDFLSDKNAHPGYAYDSLLYITRTLTGLRDSLTRTAEKPVTLFAMEDGSFGSALNLLNRFRQTYELGHNLYLKDLLGDPIIVTDTTVTHTITTKVVDGENVREEKLDTTTSTRSFDYRAKLDSLVYHYAFSGNVTSQKVMEEEGASEFFSMKVGHTMRVEAERVSASGAMELGPRFMNLVETNGTKQNTKWIKAQVNTFDIKAENGYVQQLAPNHEFGFGEILELFKNYGNEKPKIYHKYVYPEE